MKIKFWGTRGSVVTLDRDKRHFGGHTTCVEVRVDDENIIIFDMGTGVFPLGHQLNQEYTHKPMPKIYVFMSHVHWDHINGFPFFQPNFREDAKIDVFAHTQQRSLEEVVGMMMDYQFCPISHVDFPAYIRYINLDEREYEFPTFKVTAKMHIHPGGAMSFRLESKGKIFVFNTDTEHSFSQLDQRVIDISQDADLMVHDAQYFESEISKYVGWGHSTPEQAVEVAKLANVKRLGLTHHDPLRTDDEIFEAEKRVQEIFPNSFYCYDGLEIEL